MALPLELEPRPVEYADSVGRLNLEHVLPTNLNLLDSQVLRMVRLPLTPWRNASWKLEMGILANRTSDPDFKVLTKWDARHAYVKRRSTREMLDRVDDLSTAEKYDLLVGDYDETLTNAQWLEGKSRFENGKLASWMGICEGSAAAAILYPEPKRSVSLKSRNGVDIRFHILDIKGLAALLWSSYNTRISVIGSRCESILPKRDSNGLIVSSECFNVNPASFHIATLGTIGIAHSPLIINRVMNLEVWNVPVVGYTVQYINMRNGLRYSRIAEALVSFQEERSNRYTKYRTPGTVQLVGVEMTLNVAVGTTTSRDLTSQSTVEELKYVYDLELNHAGNIIGGEWHRATHPDFLWALPKTLRPISMGEFLLGNNIKWDGTVIPLEWLPAIQASSKRNQPFSVIVEELIRLSTRD